MDRVMLDIESLGRQPGHAVLSIGAVEFNETGLGDEFYKNVDYTSCSDAGLGVEPETLQWWLEQEEEAQTVLRGGEDLESVLEALAVFYAGHGEVWANSPSFDCSILEEAYDAVGEEEPWAYYEERCYRTLTHLPVENPPVDEPDVEHNALDDAKYQAKVASEILRRLDNAE